MLIACDVDGVVADIHPEWLRRYNQDYDDSLRVQDIQHWGMHRYVKPECGKEIYRYLSDADLYKHVLPLPHALDSLAYIREKLGHRVYFTTACVRGMTDAKADWLMAQGLITRSTPRALGDELVVVQQKEILHADLLIDDALHNVEEWFHTGRAKALLFDQPWNRDVEDWPSARWLWVRRVRGWLDIVEWLEGSMTREVL
jgi:5'(3')-deoxyribonucleotidase